MKKLILFILTGIILFQCEKENNDTDIEPNKIQINTGTANDINYNTANIPGSLGDTYGQTVDDYGHCWNISSQPEAGNLKCSHGKISKKTSFLSKLEYLEPGKKYFVRAYFRAGNEYYYSEEISFETLQPKVPELKTLPASEITQTSVKCGGEVTDNGGLEVDQRGLCWSSSENPTIKDQNITIDKEENPFSITITGLSANTDYFVRAYASNSEGTGYGQQVSFSTNENYLEVSPPEIEVDPNAGNASFTVNSNISWSANENASWVTTSKNGKTLNVNYTANNSANSRTAIITVKAEELNRTVTLIQKGGILPTAQFSVNKTQIQEGESVVFSNQSSNANSYLWNFGDGNSSTTANPTHTYLLAGTYTVSLKATNTYGSDTETKNNFIKVEAVSFPDLNISDFTMEPENPVVDQNIVFSVTVNNSGPGSAAACKLTIKVGGETYGKTYNIPSLSSNQSYTVTRTETLSVAQNYQATAIIDAANEVPEENENNNEFAIQFTVKEAPNIPIAYIYKNNSLNANSFKSLLESESLGVDIIEISKVASTNFSSYKVIIIGSGSGYGYTWGTSQAVNGIKESGKKVIGLGYGGASFFQVYGLSINWGNSWTGNKNSIWAVNTNHTVYKSPNIIINPFTFIYKLYNNTEHLAVYEPSLNTGVLLIGRESDDKSHYPIVMEDGHWLWGFAEDPSQMTQKGKDLFINIVSYASQF